MALTEEYSDKQVKAFSSLLHQTMMGLPKPLLLSTLVILKMWSVMALRASGGRGYLKILLYFSSASINI